MKKILFKPIDLRNLKTYPIRRRKNLVNIKEFVSLSNPPAGFKRFINELPDILAGKDFKTLVDKIVTAYRNKRVIGIALGAHVIKCGLSPVIIDLMKRGFIKAIAMNGAGAIHDYEISLIGTTSEDVRETIKDGKFGMAQETAGFFSSASGYAAGYNIGLGESIGKMILRNKNRYSNYSIIAQAYKLGIPVTIHVALGTDTIHMHPCISGQYLGKASLYDFRVLASVVSNLNKGVWINLGSAVILPEVFLKAVSIARNLGYKLNDFTTANIDMIQHYRPRENVTGRPSPRGINLIGHHEIMIPLLRWSLLAKL
jgi:hypothetical protein